MKTKAKAKATSTPTTWRKRVVIMAVAASVFVTIANSALWVNRYIFNTDNFTAVATASITSESSRRAIAQGVTNQVLADRPAIKNVVNNTAVNLISGVLGTEKVSSVIEASISKLQVVLTSEEQKSIVIDLSGVKGFLTQLVAIIGEDRQVQINPENIPNEITLLDENAIPNFYKASVIFLWLGPLSALGALALLTYPYIRWREDYLFTMAVQGSVLFVGGLLSLLIGPLFRPPLLSKLKTIEGRTVVENLYNSFIATFNAQTRVIILLSLCMLLACAVIVAIDRFKPTNKK